MQSIQRRFAKLSTRSADESGVALLLKDFDDTDRMLQKVGHYRPAIDYGHLSLTCALYCSSLSRQKHGKIPGETF